MKARFHPPNYEHTLYNQYQSCRQGGRAMTDYIEELHCLGAHTNLMENEQYLEEAAKTGLCVMCLIWTSAIFYLGLGRP